MRGRIAEEIAAAVQRGDVAAHLEKDREFHRGFVGLLGNRLPTDMAMNLRDTMRLCGVNSEDGPCPTARLRRRAPAIAAARGAAYSLRV